MGTAMYIRTMYRHIIIASITLLSIDLLLYSIPKHHPEALVIDLEYVSVTIKQLLVDIFYNLDLKGVQQYRYLALSALVAIVISQLSARARQANFLIHRNQAPENLFYAGLISAAILSLIHDGIPLYILIEVFGAKINTNISITASLMAFLCLLAEYVSWKMANKNFPMTLTTNPHKDISISSLKKGIDNTRVDVILNKQFMSAARLSLMESISSEIERMSQPKKSIRNAVSAIDKLLPDYETLIINAINLAKSTNNHQIIDLARLSAAKFIVDNAEQSFNISVESSISKSARNSRHTNEITQRRGTPILQNKSIIISRSLSQIFAALKKSDVSTLSNYCQSAIGEDIISAHDFYYNPLIASPSPYDDATLISNYMLFGHRTNDRHAFTSIMSDIEQILKIYAPRLCETPILKLSRPGVMDTLEPHWGDSAENLEIVFGEHRVWAPNNSIQSQELRDLKRAKTRIINAISRKLSANGIAEMARASYSARKLSQYYLMGINPQIIHQHIIGNLSSGRVRSHATSILGASLTDQFMSEVRLAKKSAKGHTKNRNEYARRLIIDAFRYRKDLLNFQKIRMLFSKIRILESDEAIRLSKANNVSYDLSVPPQEPGNDGGHVIVKADIRGSTTLISSLKARGLNPATYFSEYFFSPIDSIIEIFGAKKVFVEGDAIILSIEEASKDNSDFSVARACGLSAKIAESVSLLNGAAKHNGLPELEIGIGISYCDNPPLFLFDGSKPIMISDAIGNADRLSSCSWALKRKLGSGTINHERVIVFELGSDDSELSEKGQRVARYNVNGIEIDELGFLALAKQVKLKKINGNDDSPESETYSGSYLDFLNKKRNLYIRKRKMRKMSGGNAAYTSNQAYYYEVIYGVADIGDDSKMHGNHHKDQ